MALAALTLDHVLGRGGSKLITAAIHEAEKRTSGEIVVRITQHIEPPGAPARQAAEQEFVRLNLMRTKRRNAVLLFIALDEHAIELVADQGIASLIEQPTWALVVELVSLGFRCGFPAEAIIMAITKIADLLGAKFPFEPGDINELPDQIITDEEKRSRP